jgi:hypothetical protein
MDPLGIRFLHMNLDICLGVDMRLVGILIQETTVTIMAYLSMRMYLKLAVGLIEKIGVQ